MTITESGPDVAVPAGHGVLHIPDHTGDARLMWNPSDKDEVAAAKAAFDEATKNRKMRAYQVDDDGKRTGTPITEFDKKAGKIIMVRQLVGG